MKSILYSALLIWMAISSIWAQESGTKITEIDSLEVLLSKKPTEQEKIKIWNQLMVQCQEVAPEKTILYANQVIAYTKNKKNDTLLINAYQTKGIALLQTGIPEQAQQSLEKALSLSKKIKNNEAIMFSYTYLGNLAFRTGDIEKARKFFLQALNLAQKEGKPGLIAKMERGVAVSYLIQGDYQKGIERLKAILKINQELKDTVQIQSDYVNLGISYLKLGDYEESTNYFQLAMDFAQKLGDSFQEAEVHNLMAQQNQLQGKDIQALDHYQQALKIFLETKNQLQLGNVYTNLAQLYYNLKDFDKQLEYISKALDIYQKSQDKEGTLFLYFSNADTYLEHKKEYQKALDNYKKGLQLSLEMGKKENIANAYIGFGNTYHQLKQYQKAKEFTSKAIQLAEEIEAKEILAAAYVTFAQIHWDTQQLQQTKEFGEKAFELSQELSAIGVAAESAELLAQLYDKQKNYERAFHYHKMYKANSDSLLNEEKIKKITTLENQYQYDQEKAFAKVEQEKNEAALNAKIQQQKTVRNAFIIGFVLVLLSAFFILRSYLIKRKANKDLAERNELISLQAEELKITNENLAEMDRFKEEMTNMLVHDLKNPLNNIIGLTELDYQPQYFHAIHQSGQNMLNLVRNMLDVHKFEETEINLQISRVNIKGLFSRAFKQVEYLFKEKNMQFELLVDEDLDFALDIELIKRVLVNLLNNAYKYTPNNGQVSVKVIALQKNASPQKIKVSVIDNGIGIAQEDQLMIFHKFSHLGQSPGGRSQSTGLGLTFCKLVVEAHDGEIGVESQEGQGSTFWFTLPEIQTSSSQISSPLPQQSTTIPSSSWTLAKEEQQILQPVVTDLRQFEVFELSSIKSILNTMTQTDSDNLNQWKQALEDSMYAGNEERYKELLDMVS